MCGTKLVWNSLRSTFNDPSNRSKAVIEKTTWAMSRLRLVKLGERDVQVLFTGVVNSLVIHL
jgi:hypothetical protein